MSRYYFLLLHILINIDTNTDFSCYQSFGCIQLTGSVVVYAIFFSRNATNNANGMHLQYADDRIRGVTGNCSLTHSKHTGRLQDVLSEEIYEKAIIIFQFSEWSLPAYF